MGVLELVVFLAMVGVATGLNADGVALLAFKSFIWSDPKGVFKTWNTSDATPCLWKGVTCVRIQATMEDRVVSLDLSRKALSGTIAPSLGLLGHLTTVNLSNNKLTGQIPRELFRVTSLSRLYLSYNNLTGGIPAEIRNLGSQLRELEISGNRLSELPQEIVACYRLRSLVLSNNRIEGVIPVGIGAKLNQLERLDLSVNEFVGSVPDDFGNLSSLLTQAPLNLSNNHLSGSIPPSLANLRSVPIDLSNNQLSGPIPSNSYFQSQGPVAYVGNAALCGSPLKIDCTPSPSPSPVLNSSTPESGENFTKKEGPPLSKAAVVAISVGSGIAGFMLMASFVLFFLMSIRNSRLRRADSASRYLCSWRSGASETGYDDDGDLVHLSGVFSFNLEQLLRAAAYVLGKSGVGIVYKAVLDDGSVVAVRRLGEGGELKRKEFECEVKSIAQVRHTNVVSLHSYSWTPEEKLLVYDYLPNGSLEAALHGGSQSSSKGTLPWAARVRIASGMAQGLAHIHERKQSHGDIRPGNILLDGFLEPRIAGLGVRRLVALMAQVELSASIAAGGKGRGDSGRCASSVSPVPGFQIWSSMSLSPYDTPFSTCPMYQAPEVSISKQASPKSDVYSFGVVLLELFSGWSPFQLAESGKLDLVSWLHFALQQKNILFEIFDPKLLINANDNLQIKMIETLQVALACTTMNPDSRPKMKQVAEFFKQIQVTL